MGSSIKAAAHELGGSEVAVAAYKAALWAHLRGGQLGVWFRRQVAVGRFVAERRRGRTK